MRDSKRDWDVKLIVALWAYRTTFKVTTKATPFLFVYGIDATLPIEFEIPSLRNAIESRRTDCLSLKNRVIALESSDKNRRMRAQYIEAIQRRRKVIFDKKHKNRILRAGMFVLV